MFRIGISLFAFYYYFSLFNCSTKVLTLPIVLTIAEILVYFLLDLALLIGSFLEGR